MGSHLKIDRPWAYADSPQEASAIARSLGMVVTFGPTLWQTIRSCLMLPSFGTPMTVRDTRTRFADQCLNIIEAVERANLVMIHPTNWNADSKCVSKLAMPDSTPWHALLHVVAHDVSKQSCAAQPSPTVAAFSIPRLSVCHGHAQPHVFYHPV